MRHGRFRTGSGTGKRDDDFAFVAPAPELSGDPGIRTAECVDAEKQRRGTKIQVVLTFETEEGEQGRLWCEVPERLTPMCRYMRLVGLALGEPPKRGEPIHPGSVFKDKRFHVQVGYRRSEGPRGKGAARDELAETKKDAKDFLRILEIVEVLP